MSPRLLVSTPCKGYHAAWGDFDNDGVVDLHEYKHVWRNVRGMFKCVAVLGGVGVWGDYDNDGYLDIFCARDRKLYRNVGGTSFKDESSQLPAFPIGRPWLAAWADFDADGFLDLYVTGFEAPDMSAYYRDMRLRNQGDGSFEVAWTGGTQPGREVVVVYSGLRWSWGGQIHPASAPAPMPATRDTGPMYWKLIGSSQVE